MAAPTNQTPATAIPISLDYSDTLVDVDLATPANNCDVWYSYLPSAAGVVGWFASEFVSANYTPRTTVWTGPIGSLVQLFPTAATNVPLQHPVVAGTIYYYRVRNSSGLTPAASTTLTISALTAPALAAPVGSILVNDDEVGFAAALLSRTDGTVLQFKLNVAAGEAGDLLADSETIALEDIDDDTIKIYDATLGELYSVAWPADPDWTPVIRSHVQSGMYFVGHSGDSGQVAQATTLNPDGTWGLVTWDLAGDGMTALAASVDGTILYYVRQGGGLGQVERYDLVNDLPLSNLVAAVAGYSSYDIFVLSDDSVLVSYVDISPNDSFVRHYSAAGATLHTYAIGAVLTSVPMRMARDPQGDTSFWVMYADATDNGIIHVDRIQVSDGTVLESLDNVVFDGGVYRGTSAADNPRFGQSNSCPLLLPPWDIPGGSEPTPTPTPEEGGFTLETLIPRRLRRAPHLSLEQRVRFFSQLQIDLESGRGAVTGQGVDPVLMVRFSKDGAHTWGNERHLSAGAIGQYARRAMAWMIGRCRQLCLEVVVSDPVAWNLMAVYVEEEDGES